MVAPYNKRRKWYITYFPVYMSILTLFAYAYCLTYLRPQKLSREEININKEILSRKISETHISPFGSVNDTRPSVNHPTSITWPKLLTDLSNGNEISDMNSGLSNYPIFYSLYDILLNWNPDNPDQPIPFHETLQHFNYSNPIERELAVIYRNNEIPFKLYDIPDITNTVNKWNNEYLSKNLKRYRNTNTERSKNNHFLYWSLKGWRRPVNYKPPTEVIHDMSFDQWILLAQEADNKKLTNQSQHFYFMANSLTGDRTTFIAKDLPIFSTSQPNFFISNVRANKGIQCRFGMRGIIAEAHYDSGRNMIAMLKGQKRYILTPPNSCKKLGIINDVSHPSYRHSIIDWSDYNQAKSYDFDNVPAIDTIVKAGEILYVPSFWFHYIVSLEYSIQCNSRFGAPPDEQGQADIEDCLNVKLDFQEYNGNPSNLKKKTKLRSGK